MNTSIFRSTRILPRIIAPLTFMVALLFSACTSDPQTEALLQRAGSVMESHPDSAYRLLDSITPFMASKPEALRMRHMLLSTQAKNKLYLPLPSDTLFQDVVDYYDDHGTANQQLMAHYLLGCIFRDRGEAPLALQCYKEAVGKVDTLSGDCDYRIISIGPGKNWIEPKGTIDHYLNRLLGGSGATNEYPIHGNDLTIKHVNTSTIKNYGKVLDFLTRRGNGILPYSFLYSSCSTHTGLALNLAGIPTLFIHPYTVQASVWLWNQGITPALIINSYHLQNEVQ